MPISEQAVVEEVVDHHARAPLTDNLGLAAKLASKSETGLRAQVQKSLGDLLTGDFFQTDVGYYQTSVEQSMHSLCKGIPAEDSI